MRYPVLVSALVAVALVSCGGSEMGRGGEGNAPPWEPLPGNLLLNPSFEEEGAGGPGGDQTGVGRFWETVCGGPHPEIYSIDRTVAHSGRCSQRMSSDAPYNYEMRASLPERHCYHMEGGERRRHPVPTPLGNQAIAQCTPPGSVEPGRRYRASVWVKTRGLSEEWEWFRLSFYWLDAEGRFLGEVRQEKPEGPMPPTADWHLVDCEGVAPEGASCAKVYLHHHFVHGTVWFDDVWFGPADE